ncbi:hypothetical protein GWI33_002106 [Rhynchophorus ferrugineus]|uniref:Uncharacterized protein n=1 Tax=Rhynchophorus ferrugineus TaxID=354439 RepID=A0A834IPU2_RHYFE|nr:hypothetical protein GWI33_002106 [Rhynchophorus ferrugineus]
MSIQSKVSNSSLSSDSSWTIVESVSRESSTIKGSDRRSSENVTKENQEKANVRGNDSSFLSFDQFSFERIGEEVSKRAKRNRNKKKQRAANKTADDPMNLLSITACLMAILGITLMSTLLPHLFAESAQIDQFQNTLTDLYDSSLNPTDENMTRSLRTTVETLDATKNLFIPGNISEDSTCAEISDLYPNITVVSGDECEADSCYETDEFLHEDHNINSDHSITDDLKNKTQELIEKARSLMRSTTFQTFLATLVQDICIIKLICQLSRKTRGFNVSEKKESIIKSPTKKIKVPRSSAKLTKRYSDQNKNGSKNKNPTHTIPPKDPEAKKVTSNSKHSLKENGKSECERRFEELDTRWATMGLSHKQKIQQIKNQYQEEILRIKEREKETYNRKEKISFLREKYIQKLVADRNIYAHKLRRLREERQKILKELCSGFGGLKRADSKDAAVGNYAVLMPSSNDFYKTLQQLKDKESPDSSLTPKPEPPKFAIALPNDNSDQKQSRDNASRYFELKRKYLKKKMKQMRKKKARKDAKDVNNTVRDIMQGLSEATSKLLQQKQPENNNKSEEDLYEVVFDQQGKQVKQQDEAKWNKKYDDIKVVNSRTPLTKTDPSKYPKTKITHKGLL